MLLRLLRTLVIIFPLIGLAQPPPNIVIIMADDMGWGDVGFHDGDVPTPHLDGLTASGLELERFYVFPSCSPTRASVLSGLLPHRLGIPAPVRPSDPGLPVDAPLLPQVLQAHGYHTAMIGKWHLGGANNPEQRPHYRGFDQFYGSYQTGLDYFTHEGSQGTRDWWRNDEVADETGYITRLQASEGAKLIRETEDPLFLFFAPHAPHSPIQAPAETVAKFSHLTGPSAPTYGAMIAEFDDAVGKLLAAITDSGEADNTIVIFFSDNGGIRFSDIGDFRGMKNTLYEGGIRAPFVINWPGVTNIGTHTAQLSAVMDLMPTLLTAAGVPAAAIPESDGIDLRSVFAGEGTVQRDPIIIGNHQYVFITSEWKLVENGITTELYRIDIDPTESTDLAASEPEKLAELAAQLSDRVADLPIFEARAQRRRRNQ